jgi:hypothetical protein
MAGFELDPNVPLGHTGKLELLYNRALQRSKVPVTAQFLLFFWWAVLAETLRSSSTYLGLIL